MSADRDEWDEKAEALAKTLECTTDMAEIVERIAAALRAAHARGGMDAATWKSDADQPLPEDAAIEAAFPTRSGRHDLYAEALRLVGARKSKGALVALVCWLLVRLAKAEEKR